MSVENIWILASLPILLLFANKKNFLFMLSLAFLLIASSHISIKEKQEVKYPSNRIYLLIDNSYSMSCDDLKPNRLEFAKKEIKKFLKDVNKEVIVFEFNKFIHLIAENKENTLKRLKEFFDNPSKVKTAQFSYIDKIKIKKIGTDIKSVLNSINAINKSKKIIIVVSDGGDKKVDEDFIFWGFATKNGANVPGYDGVSKLNIIGKKYFRYDEVEKLIKYINNLNIYSKTSIYKDKDISIYFVIIGAIFFLLAIVKKYIFLVLLLFLPQGQIRANETLGCIFQFFGLHKMAFSEFKQSKSELSKLKTAIYYIIDDKCKKAVPILKSLKEYKKQRGYNLAICLVREKRYEEAFEKLQNLHKNYTDDKKIRKFYIALKEYMDELKETTIIYQAKKSKDEKKIDKKTDNNETKTKYSIKKENPW